jgi:hypothetical protein
MRYITAVGLILASLTAFAADDYREVHELSVTADGLGTLVIDADSGSLDVRGVAGEDSIKVRATIIVDNADEEEGRKFISKRVELRLDRDDDAAQLIARVDQPTLRWGSGGRIDIEVVAPPTVALRIDDGSGPIEVADFVADILIDDGSGSIDVRSVGNLEIDDGSGSIEVNRASGNVYVNDGSGSLTIEDVGGSVTIDDGSGSIRVNDVAGDLIIVDSGSGSVSFSGIEGTVEQDD